MSTPPSNLPFEPSGSPMGGPPVPPPPTPPPSTPPRPPAPPVPPPVPPVPPVVPPLVPSRPMTPPPEINTMPPRTAPGSREPEDIFSTVEQPSSAPTPPKTAGAMAPLPVHHASWTKYVLIGLAVILVLALGGFAFWYFAVRSSEAPQTYTDTQMMPEATSSVSVIPAPEPSDPFMPVDTMTTSSGDLPGLPPPVTTPPPGTNIPLPNTSTEPVVPPEPQPAPPIDSDQDGLSDQREIELGTNATLTDSDADTVSDGDEVLKYGTNPLNMDTDGDSYQDGAEISKGYSPIGAGACANPDCVR